MKTINKQQVASVETTENQKTNEKESKTFLQKVEDIAKVIAVAAITLTSVAPWQAEAQGGVSDVQAYQVSTKWKINYGHSGFIRRHETMGSVNMFHEWWEEELLRLYKEVNNWRVYASKRAVKITKMSQQVLRKAYLQWKITMNNYKNRLVRKNDLLVQQWAKQDIFDIVSLLEK